MAKIAYYLEMKRFARKVFALSQRDYVFSSYWHPETILGLSFKFSVLTFWMYSSFYLMKKTMFTSMSLSSLVAQSVKNLQGRRPWFDLWVGKIPQEKGIATHSSILAWRIHGQRSLVGYSLWSRRESDTTEQLILFTFPFIMRAELFSIILAIGLLTAY